MTKDELIQALQDEIDRMSTGYDLCFDTELVEKACDMLSRSIVWQDGEPPRSQYPALVQLTPDAGEGFYIVSFENGYWVLVDDVERVEAWHILRHAMLIPPEIDWPGESPLELTPEQNEACEKALENSEKYLKPQEPNHDND